MRLLPIALLCACSASVTEYPPTADGGRGDPPGRDAAAPEMVTEGAEQPGPECDGHAACWPNGWCSDEGYCLPQGLTHCVVNGTMLDCTGSVCCDWGNGEHECMAAGDCAPDGEAM